LKSKLFFVQVNRNLQIIEVKTYYPNWNGVLEVLWKNGCLNIYGIFPRLKKSLRSRGRCFLIKFQLVRILQSATWFLWMGWLHVLCNSGLESTHFFFLHCDVVNLVWRKINSWLDLNFITPNNLIVDFGCWRDGARSNKLERGYLLIWHAAI